MAINEGDVEGAIGNGREWTGGKTLGLLWNATNEIQSSQCCEECQKNYPETEMFNFRRSDGAGHPENACYCLKQKSLEERPATNAFKVFSGICPNYAGREPVRGALGQGRAISYAKSHGFLTIEGVADKNECCNVCNNPENSWLPDPKITGTLFNFIEGRGMFGYEGGCECKTTSKYGNPIPETHEIQRVAGICN